MDDPNYRCMTPALDQLSRQGWTLFDLCRLRHHAIAGLDPGITARYVSD